MAIINGKVYDWDDVFIGIDGVSGIDVKDISYERKHDMEGRSGKRGVYKGVGYGAKTNSVKVTLYREDYNLLCGWIKQQGYKEFSRAVLPFISVCYADNGQGTCSDKLYKVILNEESFKNAENDKSNEVSLTGIAMGGIEVNGLF